MKILRAILATFIFFFMPITVLAAPFLLEQIPDPSEAPSEAEIDALEEKAKAGDWNIKQQFAAAYLYEHLAVYEGQGCKELNYGHLCRAMAKRNGIGQQFLYEIVELNGDGPVAKKNLATFQGDFAARWRFDAHPNYDPNSVACQKVIRYYERAIENWRAIGDGKVCIARLVASMARLGLCMPKDEQKAAALGRLSWGCPQF